MPRTITATEDGRFLLVVSEYNDEIRSTLKSFRGARWDRDNRCWRVPINHRPELLERLAAFNFELNGTQAEAPTAVVEDETLTISGLNNRIKNVLVSGFRGFLWVRGELAGFDKGAQRRHWYFELVDKPEDGEVQARISAVCWERDRQLIERRLGSANERIELRDGIEVRVKARVDFYPRNGRLQFVVEDIDPEFSLGQLALKRRQIIEALTREGLLQRNRELELPLVPLRVGLITARESDALHDFVRTLERSAYGFEIALHHSAVQGSWLESEVIRALAYFEAHADRFDVVAIVRGGGARTDLAWFDNLEVARCVARHPLKIIVGIGHERDRSVLDEIASAAKTPTAAAELLIARVTQVDEWVEGVAQRLGMTARRRVAQEQQRGENAVARLRAAARNCAQRARARIDQEFGAQLRILVQSRLRLERRRLDRHQSVLTPGAISRRLRPERERLDARASRLHTGSLSGLHAAGQRQSVLEARVGAVDPARTLARGYSLVYGADGSLVKSPDQASPGDLLRLRLAAGELRARVTEAAKDEDENG